MCLSCPMRVETSIHQLRYPPFLESRELLSPFPHDPPLLMSRRARFRVLIMGRANAGKTTVLKKICNDEDIPIVRNHKGKVVSALVPVHVQHTSNSY